MGIDYAKATDVTAEVVEYWTRGDTILYRNLGGFDSTEELEEYCALEEVGVLPYATIQAYATHRGKESIDLDKLEQAIGKEFERIDEETFKIAEAYTKDYPLYL